MQPSDERERLQALPHHAYTALVRFHIAHGETDRALALIQHRLEARDQKALTLEREETR